MKRKAKPRVNRRWRALIAQRHDVTHRIARITDGYTYSALDLLRYALELERIDADISDAVGVIGHTSAYAQSIAAIGKAIASVESAWSATGACTFYTARASSSRAFHFDELDV